MRAAHLWDKFSKYSEKGDTESAINSLQEYRKIKFLDGQTYTRGITKKNPYAPNGISYEKTYNDLMNATRTLIDFCIKIGNHEEVLESIFQEIYSYIVNFKDKSGLPGLHYVQSECVDGSPCEFAVVDLNFDTYGLTCGLDDILNILAKNINNIECKKLFTAISYPNWPEIIDIIYNDWVRYEQDPALTEWKSYAKDRQKELVFYKDKSMLERINKKVVILKCSREKLAERLRT